MDERDLVKRVLEGNQSAVKELVSTYQRLVSHMVGRLIHNSMDREEVCQDIFMKVYDRLDTFHFESRLSTWIATIAYRTALNFLKKQQRKVREEDLDRIDFAIGREDDTLENKDFAKFVHSLIDQMPLHYRTVLTLYHLDGFSYPEIVEVMDMPVGTVKNYLFRARKKLKELSEPYIGTEIHQL